LGRKVHDGVERSLEFFKGFSARNIAGDGFHLCRKLCSCDFMREVENRYLLARVEHLSGQGPTDESCSPGYEISLHVSMERSIRGLPIKEWLPLGAVPRRSQVIRRCF